MKKRLAMAIFLVLLAAFGCAATAVKSEGTRLDRESLKNVEPGVTTRDSLLNLFGAPAESSTEDGEETLRYVFSEEKTPTYLGGVIEARVSARTATTTLEFTLKDGIVKSYKFRSAEE